MRLVHSRQRFIDPTQQVQALGRDPGGNEPAIRSVPVPLDQSGGLQPVQKPGHIGDGTDHAIAYFIPAQSGGTGTSQDPQGIVLGQRQSPLPQTLSVSVFERRCGPGQGNESLFFEADKAGGRLGHGLEVVAHEANIRVVTRIVKTGVPETNPRNSGALRKSLLLNVLWEWACGLLGQQSALPVGLTAMGRAVSPW
jgi:hypothetical protein